MGISLEKGQRIVLDKQDGGKLTKVFMGLGWDAAESKGLKGFLFGGTPKSIDLDASCVLLDKDKNFVDVVYFRQLQSKDGSIQHSGDNLTGDGDGDDEVISVDLTKVSSKIEYLVFTVSSYQGQTFNEIENASCRLVNSSNNEEIAKYDISESGSHTGMIMASVYRKDGDWRMRAIGEKMSARTVADMIERIKQII